MSFKINIGELTDLRKKLHKNPDLSGSEEKTAEIVLDYLIQYKPDDIITGIAGHGLAAVYNGETSGPVVLFRCELDALPIDEINDLSYRSEKANVSHKCGHDGHMAMISGLAQLLNNKRTKKGKVVLLYQPEEETGQGAAKVIKDSKFKSLNIDYAFALHNLPGYELNSIITRKNTFASASKGLIVKLMGKSSHAGEPENGINPAMAVSRIINEFNDLYKNKKTFKDFSLITIIHVKLGERAFGTNPGYAELMSTFRSYRNDDMDVLTEHALDIVDKVTNEEKLKYYISWVEEFPATVNENKAVECVEKIAENNGFNIIRNKHPFRWSEDFGHFLMNYKGALFGLGSGVNSPQLHNPDYNFPDEITETGIRMFYSIYNHLLNS